MKMWWQSKTLLGAAVIVVERLLELMGVGFETGEVEGVLSAIANAVGLGLVFWGRWTADQPISSRVV